MFSFALANNDNDAHNDGFHASKEDGEFRPPVIFPIPLSASTSRYSDVAVEETSKDFLKASSRLLQEHANDNIVRGKWKPLQEIRQTRFDASVTQTLPTVGLISQSPLSSPVLGEETVEHIPAYHTSRHQLNGMIHGTNKITRTNENMCYDERELVRSLHLDFVQRSQQVRFPVSCPVSSDQVRFPVSCPVSSDQVRFPVSCPVSSDQVRFPVSCPVSSDQVRFPVSCPVSSDQVRFPVSCPVSSDQVRFPVSCPVSSDQVRFPVSCPVSSDQVRFPVSCPVSSDQVRFPVSCPVSSDASTRDFSFPNHPLSSTASSSVNELDSHDEVVYKHADALQTDDNAAPAKRKRGRKRKPHTDNIIEPAKHKRPQPSTQSNRASSTITSTSPLQPFPGPLHLPPSSTTPAINLDILKQAAFANLPETVGDVTYRPLSVAKPSSLKKKKKKSSGMIVQGKPSFAVVSAPLHNRILVPTTITGPSSSQQQQQQFIVPPPYTTVVTNSTRLMQNSPSSALPILFARSSSSAPHHLLSGTNKSLVVHGQHSVVHVPTHQQFVKVFPENLAAASFYGPNTPLVVMSTSSILVDNTLPCSTNASPTFPPPK